MQRAMVVFEDISADPQMPFHEPAMVPQVLHALQPEPGDSVLDVTVGTSGHSLQLALRIGPGGLLVGTDADPGALRVAESRLSEQATCEFRLLHARFSDLPAELEKIGVRSFGAVLADLGVGTHQLMDTQRGFAFESAARLDMRFDRTGGISAWDVVNTMEEQELADIFYEYGEERWSRQIAARICEARAEGTIDTPAQLARLVRNVYARRSGGRTWRIHPATRVMMALRIYVNRELEELDVLLRLLPHVLNRGGRAAMLTYHSLEARRVKETWRQQAAEGLIATLDPPVVKPTKEQIQQNPRIRSAQLRACRKL